LEGANEHPAMKVITTPNKIFLEFIL